ncbi:hypothetical protein BG011_009978 [Mortierella polycephala]|uniref:Uncharacterized protein n=1 Tax=Mortierella polycephala TaxID=41804 RepID=A0A9P6PNF9_9FUNG|nr:hypothetical protein BG011_009978 [Mortierella polycephala]
MAHRYDLTTHTYFDVTIIPEAADQVLASTQTAAAVENGLLAGVECLGSIGTLRNHLLYRVPKLQPSSAATTTDNSDKHTPHNQYGNDQEEQRNKHIVDAISAIHGVMKVDVQTLRQRVKRDEL